MACFDQKALFQIRTHIGNETPPTDQQLNDLGDVLETTDPLVAAHAVVSQRLADMSQNRPTQFSVSGDYQESWLLNVATLKDKIAELAAEIAANAGEGSGVATIPTVIPSYITQTHQPRLMGR